MAELMSVNESAIILNGIIPESDPMYDGKDPLDLICWQVKDSMIKMYNVGIYYQICRKLNINGEHTVEISYFLSYTGRFEGCELVNPDDELVWKNEYSSRASALIEAFLFDFNQGQICPLIREPKRKLRPKKKIVEFLPPVPEEKK